MSVLQKIVYFHENETQPSLGKTYVVSSTSGLMRVEVISNSSNFELEVMGKVSNDFKPINAIDMTEADYNTKITHTNSIWEVGLMGYREIKIRLNHISDGSITVVGRVVG